MSKYNKGDLVWAKMKGFPPWPGKIVDPPSEIKRPSQANKKPFYCIYFYGSENYAWMLEDTIKNYQEYREKFKGANKPSQLKDAIEKTELVFQSQMLFKKRDNDDLTWQDNGYLSENISNNLPSINDELDAIRSTTYKRKLSSNASDTSKRSDKHKSAHNLNNANNNSENNSTFNGSDTDPLDEFDYFQEADDIDSYPIGESDFAKKIGNVQPDPEGIHDEESLHPQDEEEGHALNGGDDAPPSTPTKNLKVMLSKADTPEGRSSLTPETRPKRRVRVPTLSRDFVTRSSAVRGIGTGRRARPYATTPPVSRGRTPGRPVVSRVGRGGRGNSHPHSTTPPSSGIRPRGGARGGTAHKTPNKKTEPLLKAATPSALLTPPDSTNLRASFSFGSVKKRSGDDAQALDSDAAQDSSEIGTNALQNIQSRSLKFGFLGTGIMGKQVVHTLLNSGHQVTVWNRDFSKCEELITSGATAGSNPAYVINTCNIIFCCFSEHQALRKILLNDEDIIKSLKGGKGIVNLSTNSHRLVSDISEVLTSFGSRYLEAPLFGSHLGTNASLLILAAGDLSLYHDCEPLFKLIGKPLYLGDNEGSATKVALILKSLQGTLIASLAESFSLSEKAGINPQDILSILQISTMDCPLVRNIGKEIIEGLFVTSLPLKHQQHDIKLTLDMADGIDQPTPLLSTANELFKRAKSLGCGSSDVSAVHKAFYL